MSKHFVYTGNAYPHKNLNRLIGAVVLLNKSLEEPVKLKIASSRNVFTQRLEREIKNQGAEKYVELLGFVPDEKLKELYRNSVAFVFPSLSEGFGIPGIEAMEAGTLVLASDIPVFREIYKEAVMYFDPLDVASIVKVMKETLEMNKAGRKSKIAYAQKFVKRYSWAKMARETLNLYEEAGRDSI